MSRAARSTTRITTTRFGLPITMAAVVHGSIVLLALLAYRSDHTPLPPIYRVELIAAPPGPRAIGTVSATPPAATTPVAPPKRPAAPPKSVVPPTKTPLVTRKAPPKSTPTPPASAKVSEPSPKAGGGPEGGKGADVATIKTEGLEFPDPAYLQNVVRQIVLRFHPKNPGALHAEVVFIIRRDGSSFGWQLRTHSASWVFDQDALGAIESASRANAFGPLPASWADDVLTVIFTFDPKLIR